MNPETDSALNYDARRMRPMAGVSVADTPLVRAVIEHARRLSEPYLFNHAMRSWLFAEAMGRVKGIDYDHEVVAIGTILHDIGLTATVSGANRFEVNGADAALSFIKGQGVSDRRSQLIWDLDRFVRVDRSSPYLVTVARRPRRARRHRFPYSVNT